MLGQKQRRIESKQYREGSRGATCVNGCNDGCTTVPAHYSGKHANKLGKLGKLKAGDIHLADLCCSCHTSFDTYQNGKGNAAGSRFLLAIFETQLRRFDLGLLSLNFDGASADDIFALREYPEIIRLRMRKVPEARAKSAQRYHDDEYAELFEQLMQFAEKQIQQVYEGVIAIKGAKQ